MKKALCSGECVCKGHQKIYLQIRKHLRKYTILFLNKVTETWNKRRNGRRISCSQDYVDKWFLFNMAFVTLKKKMIHSLIFCCAWALVAVAAGFFLVVAGGVYSSAAECEMRVASLIVEPGVQACSLLGCGYRLLLPPLACGIFLCIRIKSRPCIGRFLKPLIPKVLGVCYFCLCVLLSDWEAFNLRRNSATTHMGYWSQKHQNTSSPSSALTAYVILDAFYLVLLYSLNYKIRITVTTRLVHGIWRSEICDWKYL